MVSTIFSSAIFIDVIFPFLLVFVLIFAILEKSKILGEDKHQINAIISLVIGLIFVAFEYPRGIVVNMIPFLVVVAVIILVFMILYSFVSAGKEGFSMNKGLKITFGILIGIAMIIAILVVTDYWNTFTGIFTGQSSNIILTTIIFLAVIGGAIAIVLTSSGKKGSD